MSQFTPILIFQDHLSAGGAARAANRWADVLRKTESHVIQVVGDQSFGAARLLTGKPSRGWERLVEALTGKGGRKGRVEAGLKATLQGQRLKEVWFHNIAGGVKWGWSGEMVSLARQYAPVVWTLHDMWALGDGEPYWNESEKLGRYERSPIRRIMKLQAEHRLVLTAPSQWLANLASELTETKCHFLPNPIDLNIFVPGNRAEARRRWGLPEEGLVILAGADSIKDERKGIDLLLEAWGQRKTDDTLALFGRNGQKREGIVNLGSIDTDVAMADAYRAADLYVHPARQENAPCTIQEALACGTPVLAFKVGGIPEMISSGKTGFFAEKVSINSLSQELGKCLRQPENLNQMRLDCRERAEKEWNPVRLSKMLREILAGVL
jgi:glycosyltransferase involved in cell wall biosynthesis